ncbi:Holliday junction branch migration protein RuvA [Candidatus Nomurabacteria bacterium]|nr:Holliday junction branch migration protein RuvA [Candidatus Nomurabacteria bacterium]
MIRSIQGTVVATEPTFVVLETKSGLGYQVFTPYPTRVGALGETVRLHTYFAVRETAHDLYGFASPEELGVFELLLTIPKIGPRSALQILAQSDLATLAKAVINDDASYLSKLSGIGKKSAENIVLGLRDKHDLLVLVGGTGAESNTHSSEELSDTIDALVALGYPERSVREAVRHVAEDHDEPQNAEQVIKQALKYLSS